MYIDIDNMYVATIQINSTFLVSCIIIDILLVKYIHNLLILKIKILYNIINLIIKQIKFYK